MKPVNLQRTALGDRRRSKQQNSLSQTRGLSGTNTTLPNQAQKNQKSTLQFLKLDLKRRSSDKIDSVFPQANSFIISQPTRRDKSHSPKKAISRFICLKTRANKTSNRFSTDIVLPPEYDLKVHFKHEQIIYTFFDKIQREEDIEQLFPTYISFVKDARLEPVLSFMTAEKFKKEFKIAFILERFSLLLCNHLFKIGIFAREIMFLKKVASAVYANSFIFIKIIVGACDAAVYQTEIKELQKRKLTLNEENVAENNQKLWKMLESETNGLEPALLSCLSKIKEFETEFSCDEACLYLLDVFLSAGGYQKRTTEFRNEITHETEPQQKHEISFLNQEKTVTPGHEKEYTLVLDLDETLVHCKDNESGSVVNFRPFLDEFLEAMVPLYNIVIFTAAAQDYADVVLDNIDPENKLFCRRLYRQHTKSVNSEYNLKDLALVSDDLARTIIIDNVPENFTQQKSNGIFIHSWFDDPNDSALRDLIPLLTHIVSSKTPDVRVYLEKLRNQMIDSIQRGAINPCILTVGN